MPNASTLCGLVALLTPAIYAAPVVQTFPGTNDTNVVISSVNAQLPALRLHYDYYSSPTQLSGYRAAVIVESTANCNQGPGVIYDVQVPSTVTGPPRYGDLPGSIVDASLPGWFDLYYHDCGIGEVPFLPRVIGSGGAADPCQDCVNTVGLPGDETYYIPLRWKPVAENEWRYGWVAFRVLYNERTCFTCIDGFPPYTIQTAKIDYVAIGYETDPGVEAVIGGGLCPADINYDASVNAFDILDFIDSYVTGDPVADLNDDARFDFFDIAAYLDLYHTPCSS